MRKRTDAERAGNAPAEKIDFVGFDTDGQAWGLVTRATPRPDLGEGVGMLDHVRWVRFNAIPFVPEEVVTPEVWVPVRVDG